MRGGLQFGRIVCDVVNQPSGHTLEGGQKQMVIFRLTRHRMRFRELGKVGDDLGGQHPAVGQCQLLVDRRDR